MWKLPCDSLLPEQARRFHPSAAFPWRWWKRLGSRCFQSARREWVLAPVSQMLLFGLLLLTSALGGQRYGTQAESNLSSKFQFSSNKEQNGESFPSSPLLVSRCACHVGIVHWCGMYTGLRGYNRLSIHANARCVRGHGLLEVTCSLQLRELPQSSTRATWVALQPQLGRGHYGSDRERQFQFTVQDLSLPEL